MDAQGSEEDDPDERADGHADRAGRHVHRHAEAAPPCRQKRSDVEGSKRMEGAGAEAGGAGDDQQEGEARDEADEREGEGSPGEGDAGQAGSEAVGDDAEERLGDRRHAAVRKAHETDGREAQLEAPDQDRIEHRDDAHVAVHGQVAEHQREQISVAQEVLHRGRELSWPNGG